MGLENLKSVFNKIRENTLSEKGIHGGLTNESPSTPPHSEYHSQLDELSKNISITPEGSLYPWKGIHGGLTNEFPSTPFHPVGHSILDDGVPTTEYSTTISELQSNSPQSEQERVEITAEEIKINKILETEEGGLFQMLGVNSQFGNKDGPFNWTSLYNSDHTPIVERIPIDTGRKDKDGNAILLNTLRSGMGALGNLDIMGYRSGKLDNFRGFNRGDEPYIIQPIGSDRYTTLTSRDGLPLNRALDDTSRLLKFYKTGAGVSFIVKENVINFLTSKIDATNPLAPTMAPPFANPLQGNTGFLNITNDAIQDLGNTIGSLRKPLVIEYSKRANTGLPFGNLGDNLKFLPPPPLPEGFLTDESPGFIKKKIISAAEGLLEKIGGVPVPEIGKPTPFMDLSGAGKHTDLGRGYDDKINKSGGIGGFVVGTQEHKISPLDLLGNGKGDFYVRFKDLRYDLGVNNEDGVFLYFRGFVTGITENVSPSWNSTNYIGRSESVYRYQGAERDLSFNLRVYPNNKKEFDAMYKKITYLTGMAYPQYSEQDSMMRMKAPFTELYMAHIGSRAKGQFGFIKSISYTVNESGDWDSQTSLPRLFDIAISYQILNKKPPSFRTPFYRGQNSIGETA